MTQWPALRDIMLFAGGVAGVFHETVLTGTERPTLLILFAAMMGLPAFLRQDEKSSRSQGESHQPQKPLHKDEDGLGG